MTKTKQINVRLTPEEIERIRKMAEGTCLSVGQFMRHYTLGDLKYWNMAAKGAD